MFRLIRAIFLLILLFSNAEASSQQPLDTDATRSQRSKMVAEVFSEKGENAIRDERVIAALREVPRHLFVPKDMRFLAYTNAPITIGFGQTISEPYVVALMSQLLELKPNSKVLEIGTGSGYQAAVLTYLTKDVYTIEIVPELAKRAADTLQSLNYSSVKTKEGDGYLGWPEYAPFDGIIVTCAPTDIPHPLWEQLKAPGRMVIPLGNQAQIQKLVVVTKTAQGEKRIDEITPVKFVPLRRK